MINSSEKLQPLADWQREALEQGLKQARNGEFASDEEVAKVFGRWGVDVKER